MKRSSFLKKSVPQAKVRLMPIDKYAAVWCHVKCLAAFMLQSMTPCYRGRTVELASLFFYVILFHLLPFLPYYRRFWDFTGDLTVKVDGKSSDQKAITPRSKHSATEQRRRSKINDRQVLPACID